MTHRIILLLLLILSSSIFAEENRSWKQIGSSVPVLSKASEIEAIASPDFFPIGAGLLWSDSISHPTEVEWIKLHLNFSNYAQLENWFLIIRDKNGGIADTYDAKTLQPVISPSNIWSEKISGSYAKLELYGINLTENNYKISVEKYQYAIQKSVKYSIIDQPNFEDITTLGPEHVKYQIGKSIARLEFVNQYDKTARCTGFLITDDVLMTNEHCINNQRICNNTKAYFGHETGRRGISYRCTEFLYASEPLDYALIRLHSEPGQKWGKVAFNNQPIAEVEANSGFYIIQHPQILINRIITDYKQLVRVNCQIKDFSAQGRPYTTKQDFGHTCDTEGESSGSPFFDSKNLVRGIHHWGIEEGAPLNQAVHIYKILKDLKLNHHDVFKNLDIQ